MNAHALLLPTALLVAGCAKVPAAAGAPEVLPELQWPVELLERAPSSVRVTAARPGPGGSVVPMLGLPVVALQKDSYVPTRGAAARRARAAAARDPGGPPLYMALMACDGGAAPHLLVTLASRQPRVDLREVDEYKIPADLGPIRSETNLWLLPSPGADPLPPGAGAEGMVCTAPLEGGGQFTLELAFAAAAQAG